MEEKNKKNIIIIKSGSGNKSIGSYVDIILKQLIENLTVEIKAYDNNMNKLITIEQIIKRALDQNKDKGKVENIISKINYEIGKEKEIPFIKCHIVINKDDIVYLKPLIGNKKNKRNSHPFQGETKKNKMEVEEERKNKKAKLDSNLKEIDKINSLCLENIQEFFK